VTRQARADNTSVGTIGRGMWQHLINISGVTKKVTRELADCGVGLATCFRFGLGPARRGV
jgi:hypothetical protein